MSSEIATLQEALTKIEAIAQGAKVVADEEALVDALSAIADIVDEFLEDGDEENDEDGEGEEEEEA